MANEYIFGPTSLTGIFYADVTPVSGGAEFQAALTSSTGGYFVGSQPAGEAAGTYNWVARRQAGASPAPTTDTAVSYPASMIWDGTEETTGGGSNEYDNSAAIATYAALVSGPQQSITTKFNFGTGSPYEVPYQGIQWTVLPGTTNVPQPIAAILIAQGLAI